MHCGHWQTMADFGGVAMQNCYASCLSFAFYEGNGGGEIRTHEAFRPAGFQDRCNQPLCHPSGISCRENCAIPPKLSKRCETCVERYRPGKPAASPSRKRPRQAHMFI